MFKFSSDVEINVLNTFFYTDSSLEECIRDYKCIDIIKKHPCFNISDTSTYCAKFGYLEGLKYAVSLGADIRTDNNIAVQWASRNGHLEIVKYLASLGADIRANNVVAWASRNGHLEIVMYLVSLGANIRANNDVAWASANDHLEIVMYLVSLGADITANNDIAVKWPPENSHVSYISWRRY